MSTRKFTLENYLRLSDYTATVLTEARLSPGEVRDVFYAAAEQIDPDFDEIIKSIKRISSTSGISDASDSEIKQATLNRLSGIDYGDVPPDEVQAFEQAVKEFMGDESKVHRLSFLLSVVAATNAASKQNMNPIVLQSWMREVLDELRKMGSKNEQIVNLENPMVEALPPLGFFTNLSSIARHLSILDTGLDDEGDARVAKNLAKQKRKNKRSTDHQILRTWGGKKKDISQLDFDKLLRAWEDSGRPHESEAIIKILKKEGFRNNQIMHIFRKANVNLQKERLFNIKKKRSDAVAKLAQLTYKWGLEKVAKQYIRDNHASIFDSVDEDLNEDDETATGLGLTNQELRKIFMNVAELQTDKNHRLSPTKLIDRIQDWAREIKRTPSEADKEALIKEIANLLADVAKDQTHEQIVQSVEKIIRSSRVDPNFADKAIANIKMGKVMERENYLLVTCFLLECGTSWNEFALRPTAISENKIRIDHTIYGRDILIEDLLCDAVMLQYIKTKNRGD